MKRKRLIRERHKLQLTQNEIAQKLDIKLRHYQSLEAGTSNGAIPLWKKIKQITGKPIDYLLEQADDSKKAPDSNQA